MFTHMRFPYTTDGRLVVLGKDHFSDPRCIVSKYNSAPYGMLTELTGCAYTTAPPAVISRPFVLIDRTCYIGYLLITDIRTTGWLHYDSIHAY